MEARCQKFNPAASKQKIGILHLGRAAPGTQNVIDGLLRYRKARTNIKLIGFRNGRDGFLSKDWFEIKEENYKNFRNLGGLEFLGRSEEKLRGEEMMEKAR
jgi:6-phosphofructokinase